MKFYRFREDQAPRFTGNLNAAPRWMLPGIQPCASCGLGGKGSEAHYPCVDLSHLPKAELRKFRDPWPVPREEFNRRRELVRPLVPPGSELLPGSAFGPTTGTGSGYFGQLFMQSVWTLYMRREALEKLHAARIQGLQDCPLNVVYRLRDPPELVDLQFELHGRFHPDCVPKVDPPCPVCGEDKGFSLPQPFILDAASMPKNLDVFRLAQWTSIIVASERMVEAVTRLGLDGVVFQPLESR